MSSTKFHFSPRPNRAGEINWREWGDEAFREALDAGKPLLLSLSAVWCHWCHVMDETSYSNEGVISYINQHYIPVRVDNDQRPDINARYNLGGWPTTAFLTPEGEILSGGTYIPPDQMLEVLPKVYIYFINNRDQVKVKTEEQRGVRSTAQAGGRGEVSQEAYDTIVASISGQYDPVHGGFGDAPKFPHTDALDLLLYAHRKTRDPDVLHMARRTLESMAAAEVYDHEWGGFFRYATNRDWSVPHYEKMLEDNAGLLSNLLTLYRTTNTPEHATTANGVIEYVRWKLRDKAHGYFYGSQDADEEFYKLSKADREGRDEPYIDPTCYTSWNAMMISAFLEASWTLDRPELRDEAITALRFLLDELRRDGVMHRFRPQDGEAQVPGLLTDQAFTARALLDAHEVTGDRAYFDDAVVLAELIGDRFADADGGGFFDVWGGGDETGRLKDRQKSLQDNTCVADVLLRLHHLTRDERWQTLARTTLEAFAGTYAQMGHFAAAYGRQVDILLNPPAEVNIVGADDELLGAALRLDVPARVVQVLDPARDAERLAALGLPAQPAPAAYACAGTMCSPPVTDAVRLAETVAAMQSGSRVIELPE
ncbi:MAG: thioredoxin domain-containing protein [Chloroflexi bacterium]|nr:thioredoxin domain-containing protein [Chloroflexota bacterium]